HTAINDDPEPVATSRPYGGIYQMFETDFDMESGNVVPDAGDAPLDRGIIPPFKIFYDSALKLFQVATQQYTIFGPPYQGFLVDPDYAAFVGDRVRVR